MVIAKDKKLHLAAGLVVGAIAMFVLPQFGIVDRGERLGLSVLAAALVGVAKEIKDKFTPGSVVDPLDAVFTAIGGVVGAVGAAIVGQFTS